VADDPDVATFSVGLTAETELRLYASLDLAEIAGLVLDATVPDFAEVASVYVLDRPLRPGDADEITVRRIGSRLAHASRPVTEGALPAGEVIAFTADSPYARCLSGGKPVIFAEPDRQTVDRIRVGCRGSLSDYTSFLLVPTSTGAQVRGFLAFARAARSTPFGEADVIMATRLASVTGAGIAGALALARDRTLADTLQRSLLAHTPRVPAGLEVAARCLPASGQVIGGDWYDIIALPGGRTGLIIGDVMGHGPEAAAVMAQLRTAAHALAQLDLSPADLLGQLDRVTVTLRRPVLATCVYGVIDPVEESCTLSAAGHLPPVLALTDGTTRVPDLPSGQSLGLGSGVYGEARIRLTAGTVIALYTDGLVETRTRPFDQGILAVCSALGSWRDRLDVACDTLIASLAERYEDDVTVVLARIPAP
jgi:hypothetical protein